VFHTAAEVVALFDHLPSKPLVDLDDPAVEAGQDEFDQELRQIIAELEAGRKPPRRF
jgi:hypothetical protein